MRIERKDDYFSAKSLAATFTNGSIMELSNMYGYSFDMAWTGTPAGDLIVQGSNTQTTWHEIAKETLAGAAGSKLFNVDGAHYRYVRVSYTRTGGTGSVEGRYYAKGS